MSVTEPVSAARRDFWSWWRDGLRLWWRAPAPEAARAPRLWLQARADGGFLAHAGVNPGIGHEPDALPARHRTLPAWLLVPASAVVRAPMSLPLAALDHLDGAVRYQIERLTPFKAEDVSCDVRVVARDADTASAMAELVAMPRAELNALLERVRGEWRMPLSGVDVLDEAGLALGVNLLPPPMRAASPRPWRMWNALLAGFALVALVAGFWFALQRERQQADALEAQLRTQAAEARIVSQQRDRLRALTDGAGWVAKERGGKPQVTVLLNALAERIPSHTALEQFRLQKDELQIQGIGPDSAALIGALRGAPQWGQPALAGTTTAMGNSDRFSIRLPLKSAQGSAK